MARVLIADDAAIVRKMMREMLEQAGHVVVGEAAHGEEAVRRHAETRPDVAIIDVNMPVVDGFAAAAAIRASNPEARLIIASVHATASRVRRALELGAGFLPKPFDSETLLRALAREEREHRG